MAMDKCRLHVDGWNSAVRTTYELHGCKFHGNPNCQLTNDRQLHPKSYTPLMVLYEITQKNHTYLEDACNVQEVDMWEFQWQRAKKGPAIHKFLNKIFERVKTSYRKKVRSIEAQIVKYVEDETLFGLVECDIHVPDDLREKFAITAHFFFKILKSLELILMTT